MALMIGDITPNFVAQTSAGEIHFHEWIANRWVVLIFHSQELEREINDITKLKNEFEKREIKLLGVSANRVFLNLFTFDYPIAFDDDLSITKAYGALPSATDPLGNPTYRLCSLFIVGPDRKIRLSLVYPTNSNFQEVLRLVDSLQLAVKTPANWKVGEDVIISGQISKDEPWNLAAHVRILGGVDVSTPRYDLPSELLQVLGDQKNS